MKGITTRRGGYEYLHTKGDNTYELPETDKIPICDCRTCITPLHHLAHYLHDRHICRHFFLFVNPGTAIVVVTLLLVSGVGILSFLRHSVYYRSDQARMGWSQEHPEFQIEVGFANLAIGLAALIAIVLNMGPLAYGMALLTYALYLLCTLVLHAWEAMYSKEMRKRAVQSTFNTGLFTLFLLLFAVMAFMQV